MGTGPGSLVYNLDMRRLLSKTRGFTLIELIISVSIIIILAAIAVPRYGDFSRQQDLNYTTQSVVSCLQKAQRQAISPPSGLSTLPRYSGAVITSDVTVTPPIITCATYLYPLSQSTDNLVADGTTGYITGTNSSPMMLSNVSIDSTVVTTNSSQTMIFPDHVQVFFGVLEKGLPIAFSSCSTISSCITLKPPTLSLISGYGLTIKMSNSTNDSQTISMGRLGTPIGLDNL